MKNKKRIGNLILSAVLPLLILLSSCTAIHDIERLGFSGWLSLGDLSDDTKTPLPTESSAVTAKTEEAAGDTVTPEKTEQSLPTSLPVISPCPKLDTLLEEYGKDKRGSVSAIRYISGTPDVFSLYGDIFSAHNSAVIERYSVKLSDRMSDFDTISGLMQSGKYFADVLYLPLSEARRFASAGLLEAIDRSLLRTDKGYYTVADSNFSDYYLVPSSSVPYESAVMLFVNTDLLERTGICTDIYSYAEECWNSAAVLKLMYSLSSMDPAVGKPLVSMFDTEKTADLFNAGENGCGDTMTSLLCDSPDKAIEMFRRGEALFLAGNFSLIRELGDSYDSYATLPLPGGLTDGVCEYVFNDETLWVYAIPKSAMNKEFGLFLADISAFIGRFEYKYKLADDLYTEYLRENRSTSYMPLRTYSGKLRFFRNDD